MSLIGFRAFFIVKLRSGENAPRISSPRNSGREKCFPRIFTAKLRPGENVPNAFSPRKSGRGKMPPVYFYQETPATTQGGPQLLVFSTPKGDGGS